MSVNSNAKGKRGEREVVNLINRSLGTNFRRTPNSGGLSFKGDVIDVNVDNPLYDFHIEIKNTKILNIPSWMKQIHRDIPLGKRPLLIFKHRAKYHTALELRDLLHLVKTNMELKEQYELHLVKANIELKERINELTEQLNDEHD